MFLNFFLQFILKLRLFNNFKFHFVKQYTGVKDIIIQTSCAKFESHSIQVRGKYTSTHTYTKEQTDFRAT